MPPRNDPNNLDVFYHPERFVPMAHEVWQDGDVTCRLCGAALSSNPVEGSAHAHACADKRRRDPHAY